MSRFAVNVRGLGKSRIEYRRWLVVVRNKDFLYEGGIFADTFLLYSSAPTQEQAIEEGQTCGTVLAVLDAENLPTPF